MRSAGAAANRPFLVRIESFVVYVKRELSKRSTSNNTLFDVFKKTIKVGHKNFGISEKSEIKTTWVRSNNNGVRKRKKNQTFCRFGNVRRESGG